MLSPEIILVGIITVLVIIFAFLGIKVVPESKAAVVERLGKYNKTLTSGVNFIIPGIDTITKKKRIYTIVGTEKADLHGNKKKSYERYDLSDNNGFIELSEQIIDPESINVIASDNAVLIPDIICHFMIVEPHKTLYNVNDLYVSMNSLLETTLRQSIGRLDSDQVVVSRAVLGNDIKSELERASESWGIRVTRVEIESILFEDSVQEKLTKAREAELERRAAVIAEKETRDREILKAEADKKAAILRAEGEKTAILLRAEAQFESDRLKAEGEYLLASRQAEGEAKGIEALALAVQNNPDAVIALKAIEAQPKIADAFGKSNNAIIIPNETAGIIGSMATLKNLWNKV